jgi:uncharacterized DUF497 family protein
MRDLRFEWDPAKDSANRHSHGVSFIEAQAVFSDELARFKHDPDHSDDEDRFLLLGLSSALRLLVVCHCHRKKDETIRIISARKANRKEQRQYHQGRTT